MGSKSILGGRTLHCAIAFACAALYLAAFGSPRAEAIFRAFSPSSLWNVQAVPTDQSNPYASQFADAPGFAMKLSGTPDKVTYGSPVYFAQRGDPTAPVLATQRDWLPTGDTRWNGRPIPVPSGVTSAPGSDGHLTVVSADRRTSWEFLGCTQAGVNGYVTRVIVQWDLTGDGHSGDEDDETSARGSGTPLISTSLRAEEALRGVRHALGITVPRVSSSYIAPATHSDGKQGPDAIQYGMRFVLRPDYQLPANASIGVVNVTWALKTYGAYVIDQGADFEMDADSTHPELWRQAGLSEKTFGFTADDFRPAQPGTPGAFPLLYPSVVLEAKRAKRAVLRSSTRPLRIGHHLILRGRVRGVDTRDLRARLEARASGGWRHLKTVTVRLEGKFKSRTRLGRVVRPESRHGAMVLGRLHIRAGVRSIKIRAVVPGVGPSNVVLVRLAG